MPTTTTTNPTNRSKSKKTSDALVIFHNRFVRDDPAMQALIREEREKAAIGRQIREMRMKAGLSQRGLAKRLHTSSAAISRLEDANYEGHSMRILERVAKALNCRVSLKLEEVGSM